jgi:hypothetical protein
MAIPETPDKVVVSAVVPSPVRDDFARRATDERTEV